MTDGTETAQKIGGESLAPERSPSLRGSLSRARVLDAAQRLVEEHGLEALSMRRLGAELGVEAMSLYRYFPSKDGLLDGLAEQLWREVPLPEVDDGDWTAAVRPPIEGLRALAQFHPRTYPLLFARGCLPEPALVVFDSLLGVLRRAGFGPVLAAQALGALLAYAIGYAMVELCCGLGQPDLAAQCCARPPTSGRFADVARALGECDPNAQFTFGLDAILAGLEAQL